MLDFYQRFSVPCCIIFHKKNLCVTPINTFSYLTLFFSKKTMLDFYQQFSVPCCIIFYIKKLCLTAINTFNYLTLLYSKINYVGLLSSVCCTMFYNYVSSISMVCYDVLQYFLLKIYMKNLYVTPINTLSYHTLIFTKIIYI